MANGRWDKQLNRVIYECQDARPDRNYECEEALVFVNVFDCDLYVAGYDFCTKCWPFHEAEIKSKGYYIEVSTGPRGVGSKPTP